MKRRTSWPSLSRKYSAKVTPESATRRRAPGGSFIWPNTIAVLSMTCIFLPEASVKLASFISSQRSLPSRVRSPTPANTDTPPASTAMFRISSWTVTVLPTPAPPKRPIFPPLGKGQRRSTTLRPVWKTRGVGSCSERGGGERWIG